MNSLYMTVILKGKYPCHSFFFCLINYSQHILQGECEKRMEIKCILGLPRRVLKRKVYFSKNEVFLINCEYRGRDLSVELYNPRLMYKWALQQKHIYLNT